MMPSRFLLRALLFTVATMPLVNAQDSTVPESVRLMIERSQGSNQYELTARMQMDMQYREFLGALSGNAQRRALIESTLLGVLTERVELSSAVAYGRANEADMAEIADYSYLRDQLAPLLYAPELAILDGQSKGPSEAQLKRDYAEELTRSTTGLTDMDKDLVLDTLIKHLQADRKAADSLAKMSVDELVMQQIQTIRNAGIELESRFDGDKWQQVMNFLNQLQSNLYMNRSMSDAQ